MNTLLVSYDLWWPETSKDYETLIKQIKSYSDYKKALESFRFIKTIKNSADVRDELKRYVDKNDKLLVINVTWDGRWSYWLPVDVTEWMKKNM